MSASCLRAPSPKLYEVIVVGAGFAGLACANSLIAEHGVSNILVLEAHHTIGGRCQQDPGFLYDDSKNNPNPKKQIIGSGYQRSKSQVISKLAERFHLPLVQRAPMGLQLELGCELVHGGPTSTTDLIQEINNERRSQGLDLMTMEEFFVYCHGDGGPADEPVNGQFGLYCVRTAAQSNSAGQTPALRWLRYDATDKDFVHSNHLVHSISETTDALLAARGPQYSMLDYLKEDGQLSGDMEALVEAGFANTFDSTLSKLAVQKVVQWERYWALVGGQVEGDKGFTNGNYGMLIQKLAKPLKSRSLIKTNSAVSTVRYSHENRNNEGANQVVNLSLTNGREYRAKKVVFSASPAVFKAKMIDFQPELPPFKKEALDCIDFRRLMKVFMKFDARCWPEFTNGIICGNMDVPEIWFAEYNLVPGDGLSPKRYMATGFIGANAVDSLLERAKLAVENGQVKNRDDFIVDVVLNQLEDMFNIHAPTFEVKAGEEKDPSWREKKVKEHFIGGFVSLWAEDTYPYIRGGYTSPMVGANYNNDYTEKLARPVADTLFFCGEATNLREGTTTQAAMDSGKRAAEEVVKSLGLLKPAAVPAPAPATSPTDKLSGPAPNEAKVESNGIKQSERGILLSF